MSQTGADPAMPERRRIKSLEAMVAEVVQETTDTTTLVLFTGNERLEYEALINAADFISILKPKARQHLDSKIQ